jgi:diadenylate cyclase
VGETGFQLTNVFGWRWLVDIALVAALVYQLLVLLRGSRSGAMLIALGLLFGVYYVSQDQVLNLPTVNWLLDRFISSIVVLLAILFQDDIRRALTSMVRSPLVFSVRDPASSEMLEEVLRACTELSRRQLGALIVIEQEASLDRWVEDGVKVDAGVSWQLLLAMFIPEHTNATHDGAAIIQKNRVAAAACFLPLAGGAGIPGTLGSRHRAALGLADETDAIVVVVSEETGTCSLAYMGQLDLNLTPADLRERFRLLFGDQSDASAPWRRMWRRRIVSQPRAQPTGTPPRRHTVRVPRQEPASTATATEPAEKPMPLTDSVPADDGRADKPTEAPP